MKKMMVGLLLASAVAASPALARDNSGYVGIEGGVLRASNLNFDATTTTGTPATIDNLIRVDLGNGYDVDGIAGYDFGMFRLEGELGFKRAKIKDVSVRDFTTPAGPYASLGGGGHAKVFSAMVNGLIDLGSDNGFGFYAGPGIGYARTKLSGGGDSFRDSGLALQGIAGIRYAVSQNLDLGLKYRYFRGSKLRDSFDFLTGTTPTSATVGSPRFKSSSLLASLVYNFAAPAPPPPPPPPPPPSPAGHLCLDRIWAEDRLVSKRVASSATRRWLSAQRPRIDRARLTKISFVARRVFAAAHLL